MSLSPRVLTEFPKNIGSAFNISKIASLQHIHLVNGYGRECNKLIPYHELIIMICLWYYHQIIVYHIVDNFDDMDLHKDVLGGIYAYGFEKPSIIQQHAIKPMIHS